MSGQAGQAPGVVKARLSGAPQDVQYVARFPAGGGIGAGEDIGILDQSTPYPNRRDPRRAGVPDGPGHHRRPAMTAGRRVVIAEDRDGAVVVIGPAYTDRSVQDLRELIGRQPGWTVTGTARQLSNAQLEWKGQ